MKLFPSAKALFALLLGLVMVAGLSACGGTGGDADTDAPEVALDPIPVTTTVRTRLLSGRVEAGATVEVFADSAMVTKPTISTPMVENGTWSASVDLVPGNNTLYVKASDSTGNNKTLAFLLTYDVFTLDSVLAATPRTDQVLTGTLENANNLSTLTAKLNDADLAVQPVITDNTWSLALTALPAGSNTLVLAGTDSAGNTDSLTQPLEVNPARPDVSILAVVSTGKSATINGTFTGGGIVSLTVPGAIVGEVIQDSVGGTWSSSLSSLPSGRNVITVTATNTDATIGTAQAVVIYQP